ncbi:hypothetical protein N7493_003333 [Penicillium malachiteum]|uniref:Major facilitator superfamily (MFS) profile domain-containing protein n=1 Tax=Penicillium malachiteum TaxID=1324776 RepID=A0AAD6HPF9_9EURO|nr:hypothetical protein N7493_003333 [Penicillium malachiteum]
MSAHTDQPILSAKPESSLPDPTVDSDLSTTENQTPEKSPVPPPPNGGLNAWLQVAAAFFLFFNSWGLVNTFGVFQTYYEDTLLSTYSASSISWIGTVQGFLLLLAGVIVGPAFDKGHLKSLVAIGLFLVVFGLMMTSFSRCCRWNRLCISIPPFYSRRGDLLSSRRALATGITAAGGSIGSVIYPIVFHKLIGPVGFGWTTRIIAFIALAGSTFSLAVMKQRLPPPQKARSLIDLSAFKELPFVLLCFALFFSFTGLYFPFFYLPSFFSDSLHANSNISFYIISVLNASSVVGRITPGLIADRVGSLNTVIPVNMIATIMAFAWMGIHNEAGAIVFACIYGFASGAIVSLPPTILLRLSPNLAIVGTRMGMVFTCAGLGLLIGNPIAGALLNLEQAIFWKAQLFCAIMVVTGLFFFIWLRLLKWRHGEGWKF